MARVLMVSSEAAPLAKTGGLADVVGSLPSALQSFDDRAAVVIPRYGSIDLRGSKRVYDRLPVYLGPNPYNVSIYQAPAEYPLYLVDCPPLFDRKEFYGELGVDYPDNHIRFAVFCRAALGVARHLFRCDILHCHDWQSGLIPAYLKSTFATDPVFLGTKTLFTIHNLGFQGIFPATVLPEVAIDPMLYRPDGLEFFGQVSYIKSGISFADALNTVSPTYAREIRTPQLGFGLDGALRARDAVLSGILNGVDYREWSPESDPLIPARYSVADLSGKAVCKEHLLQEFGLPAEALPGEPNGRPLIGIVSRLTVQKGVDLIVEAVADIVAAGANLVAIGTGEPEYEALFQRMAADFPGRVGTRIGFDNRVAHLIEAGADMFLMPSRYEPCGLNQIYSLRYGTVPVVRATGGLDDTIDSETGFKFVEYSSAALLAAVRQALEAFSNRDAWQDMMRRGMQRDFSWKASAGQYSALYRRLLGGE
ncbi:MAG: glycogen synthase GlgA [Bryobacteraceae bacterium]